MTFQVLLVAFYRSSYKAQTNCVRIIRKPSCKDWKMLQAEGFVRVRFTIGSTSEKPVKVALSVSDPGRLNSIKHVQGMTAAASERESIDSEVRVVYEALLSNVCGDMEGLLTSPGT